MGFFKFSVLKLFISILIIIISLILFVNESINCPTGRNCSPILLGQWPFIIIGLVSLAYLIILIIPKK